MNKILEIKFGSHLYGTDTPNSDLDLKGIYLPTAKEICLGNYKKTLTTTRPKREFERNNKDDVDIEIFSLNRYVELLVDGQVVALDMLFSPENAFTNITSDGYKIINQIYLNRNKFISKSMTSKFFDYAKQQAAKYGQKGFRIHALRETLEWFNKLNCNSKLMDNQDILQILTETNEHIKFVDCKGPSGTVAKHFEVCGKKYAFHNTIKYVRDHLQKRFEEYGHRALLAEKNEGIDWKALSHAVRVNSEAKELLDTGFITFPCPNRQLLLDIKLGKMDYKDVAVIIDQGLEDLKASELTSTLPEYPDMDYVNNFIYEIYREIVSNG